jgi:cysteine desulfurase / selenocysteine lyase
MFDPEKIRRDFPILNKKIRGNPFVYLDTAASAQKPKCVIDCLSDFYENRYSSVHRGLYYLSDQATQLFEDARIKIQKFINAKHLHEIIFVRGTTEAINLVAQSYGTHLKAGDEIIISAMEHHANIIPWQVLCKKIGAILRVIPIDDHGQLLLNEYRALLNERTKLVAITHISNVLGTINPIKTLISLAHQNNTPVLIDGAQGIVHAEVDVQSLDCDFYTFSGHKLFGPNGIGILYGKECLLNKMPPYQTGGNMITRVSFDTVEYRELPFKFEAGTPPIAEAIALGAAIDYLETIDRRAALGYEHQLLNDLMQRLTQIKQIRLIGTAQERSGIVSFVIGDVHAHDVGTILDAQGIAVRVGHHCAMPLMQRFNVPATVRVSLAFYNLASDIDALITGLHQVKMIFKR